MWLSTHLYKRGYFGHFLFHIQLKCLCQGTLYQCLRLPTIFFQIIQTSKQGPINQPSEPCSFQLLRTLFFLQCLGSQQSKAKPGPHFVHASCYDKCISKYLSRSSYYPSKSEKWIYTVYLWNRRRILGVSCSRRWRSLQNPRKIWL